ncbi:hypothetical protein L195_g007985 [Trifolium pratense]|uniref:Uncharacterized protein n=1 Tax=Trifolium pratense TaxID=57577 RepID=A0A2K3P7X1_TRIPR|nr:hypothetical protein L195_g026355 [Trifolium pratense]PNY11381.1 hypothetical protein L195_g007985 [Trifolium pratense]
MQKIKIEDRRESGNILIYCPDWDEDPPAEKNWVWLFGTRLSYASSTSLSISASEAYYGSGGLPASGTDDYKVEHVYDPGTPALQPSALRKNVGVPVHPHMLHIRGSSHAQLVLCKLVLRHACEVEVDVTPAIVALVVMALLLLPGLPPSLS